MLKLPRIIVVSTSTKFTTYVSSLIGGTNNYEILSTLSILQSATLINRLTPNIIVYDIEDQTISVPYLKQLIGKYNLAVIIVAPSMANSFQYMQAGIKDILVKPKFYSFNKSDFFIQELDKRIQAFLNISKNPPPRLMSQSVDINQKIIALASSTGGTEAVYEILKRMPENIPPMLIVQHMPAVFTKLFADRLNKNCPMEVQEGQNGLYLRKGLVYIAPGDLHMKLVRRNSMLAVECFEAPKVNSVRPAADILFNSVAQLMGNKAIGVILTGMGNDGAKGLLEMRAKGAKTIGQDEGSSVVYGMPKAAFNMGAVMEQHPLEKIPAAIMKLV